MALDVARVVDLSRSEEDCGSTALQRVRRALDELAPGEGLEVRTVVAEHAWVVRAWARKAGVTILEEGLHGRESRLVLERPDPA